MNPETKVYSIGDRFSFDVVDLDDTIQVKEDVLPELLYSEGKQYANYDTAARNGDKWIEKFNKASEPRRRTLCGYDSVDACRYTPRPLPALRKASNRTAG